VPTASITLDLNDEDVVEEKKGQDPPNMILTERNQIEELLMAELESLFDRPNIVQPTDHSTSVSSSTSKPGGAAAAQ